MVDFIIVAVLIAVVGAALAYIRKERKKGVKCIGCPNGASCAHCGCNCGSHGDAK